MHGGNLKLIDARQAKVGNIYKNTKFECIIRLVGTPHKAYQRPFLGPSWAPTQVT
jgi:hypothetical protein